MTERFIKLMVTKETVELAKHEPYVFSLLAQIAMKAKRTNRFSAKNLEIGQVLIKGCKSVGMTDRRYRRAKGLLETWGFTTNKATSKGTIVTLIDSRVYDINKEGVGRAKGRTRDEQGTSSYIYKNEKNEKNTPGKCPYQTIVGLFNEMLSPKLPTVQKISEKRKKAIKARWLTSDKTQSINWWKDFFSHIADSDFLMGRAKDNFRASFDWIIKESNFFKILEGNYN